MSNTYAKEFAEISEALTANTKLQEAMLLLVGNQPIAGKVIEGANRLSVFREILQRLISGEISFLQANREVENNISSLTSIHAHNVKVFPSRWAERLLRTQYSRFYSQTVLEKLLDNGETDCYIAHSSEESVASNCSRFLAGYNHDAGQMHSRLISAYGQGIWDKSLKVPDHPHCSHVISPAQ